MNYRKKYENALEKAKSLHNSMFVNNDILEQIFPELKESEEEQHRRLILEYLYDGLRTSDEESKEQIKTAIDWFEKRVNADCIIKPKFRMGDWIACDNLNTVLILTVEKDEYIVETTHGTKDIPSIDFIDRSFHLWSIKDAKDGDILVDGDAPFIFKGLLDPKNPGCPVAYCGLDDNKEFIVGSGADGETNYWCSCGNIKPATKEQKRLLFQKMNETCYIWVSDKKELMYIPDKNE